MTAGSANAAPATSTDAATPAARAPRCLLKKVIGRSPCVASATAHCRPDNRRVGGNRIAQTGALQGGTAQNFDQVGKIGAGDCLNGRRGALPRAGKQSGAGAPWQIGLVVVAGGMGADSGK